MHVRLVRNDVRTLVGIPNPKAVAAAVIAMDLSSHTTAQLSKACAEVSAAT